jgi:hypothetical protein
MAWVGGCVVSGYSALALYRIQEIFRHKLDKGIGSIERTQDINTGQIETWDRATKKMFCSRSDENLRLIVLRIVETLSLFFALS